MSIHYVLIDLENVPLDCSQHFVGPQFRFFVFVGNKQKTLPVESVAALQPLGDRLQYIEISGSGPNALDFHIAYYLGKITSADPSATFHIISKDKGYDPLLEHLKAAGIKAERTTGALETPPSNEPKQATPNHRIEDAVSLLQRMKKSKPGKIKSLNRTLETFFKKQLSNHEIQQIVSQLVRKGYVKLSGTAVTYTLPVDHS